MSIGKQYGIKEVLDFVLKDFATQKPFAWIDYATATSNEVAGERLPIKGGRGMAELLSFDHSKTSQFTLNLPLVDLELLARLAGHELITDVTKDLLKMEKLIVKDGSIRLSKTPTNPDKIELFKVEGNRDFGEELEGEYADGKLEVSITSDVKDGDAVFALYQYKAPATTKQIKVTSNSFPAAVSMEGYGIARNQIDEQDYAVYAKIYKARPRTDFTFTLAGEEATNLEIVFDVYEADVDGDKTYVDYFFLEEDENAKDEPITTP